MAIRQKRLCKSLEALNCRSRALTSQSIRIRSPTPSLDSSFRVLAYASNVTSELAGTELERHVEEGVQLPTNKHLCAKKAALKRTKSAEELHFEAVQDYHLIYEKESGYHPVNEHGNCVFQADVSSLQNPHSPVHMHVALVDTDKANTPVGESMYVEVHDGVSSCFERNPLDSLANRFETVKETSSDLKQQATLRVDVDEEEYITPVHVSQARFQRDVVSDGRNKSMPIDTVQSLPNISKSRESSQALQSTPLLDCTNMGREIYTNSNLDTSPLQKKLDNDESIVEDVHSEENTYPGLNGDLSEEQKIRMELNKAAALARRNMRKCEEEVVQAQGKGLSFPKFESLLVEKSWVEVLGKEFQKPYMERLHQFVSQEAGGRIPIYPSPAKLFNAFNSCPFDKVKVVIIGQDPYHAPGQAMGLCFSVEKGIKLPSSLSNMFLEIESDLHCNFPLHGNLEKWSHQGVLLLNTVLTVRDHHANSHAKKGWELFTDAAIRALAQQRSGIVFLLWGNQAQEKIRLINKTSHHILKAFHPSGISAHRGFFKCRHFSKTNQILAEEGLLPIDWQL